MVSDYISREAALAFQDELAVLLCKDVVTGDVMSATKDADLVKYLLSISTADVRPVVCCKDCVYAYPYGLEIKCTKHSGKADRLGEDATYSEFHSENWYCADAQRKMKGRE